MKIRNYDLYAKSREMVRSFLADKEAFNDTFEAFGVIVGMVNLQKNRIAELEASCAAHFEENQRLRETRVPDELLVVMCDAFGVLAVDEPAWETPYFSEKLKQAEAILAKRKEASND